jgi:DNA-binding transcriptional LysR family regulator
MIDITSIDLNLLKIFDALHRELHVSRAAKRLRLTQPAVSMGLNRLRSLTGDELFVRSSKSMIPTSKAVELGPKISEALSLISGALTQKIAFDPKAAEGDIRISVDDYLAQVKVLPMIRKTSPLMPRVRFEIISLKDRDPNAALQGEQDFAIRAVPNVSEGLYVKRLATENFKVLVSPNNKAVGKSLTLKAYTELEHVLASPFGGFNGIVDHALAEKGLKRLVRFSVGHFSLAPLFVQNTNYLLTMPASIAKVYETQFSLRCFDPPLSLPNFHVSLYWHERVHKSPLHRLIRDLFENSEE